MIELTIDDSPGPGKKNFYFRNTETFDLRSGRTDCMTYDQSLLVKKALKDLDIDVFDRVMLIYGDIGK